MFRRGKIAVSPTDFVALGDKNEVLVLDCSSEIAKDRAIVAGARYPVVFRVTQHEDYRDGYLHFPVIEPCEDFVWLWPGRGIKR